ncbi:MAG: DNA photolyase family protein [Candidatus Binatia bacterium]|nr:DNA photolyase family protein [Candidatus Binatia bacterium]
MPTTVVWFHNDLRVRDHAALSAACERGAVVGLFVWAPGEQGERAPGAARRWWLHHALVSLRAELAQCGVPLVLRRAERAAVAVEEVVRASSADAVFWNRRYDPAVAERDTAVASQLRCHGIWVEEHAGGWWQDAVGLAGGLQRRYQVFTPFWRWLANYVPASPLPAPRARATPTSVPASDDLAAWHFLPRIPWDRGFYEVWQPSEAGAHRVLERFVHEQLGEYALRRDLLAAEGTSRLSPYLAHGQLSPAQVWHAVRQATVDAAAKAAFLRQLAWREFAYQLLVEHPDLHVRPLRAQFETFPWREETNDEMVQRWRQGNTGIPLVDAGMRELWATGWMHNRARMVVASWLTKNLLCHWRLGERWFWDTLVDADPANNPFGWQWVAGCGADAAPYWRVFQPVRQGETYDREGAYVRHWVPELRHLPDRWIHRPWQAPGDVLARAGVVLGKTYPQPLVDPDESRKRALATFEEWRRSHTAGHST